jgi:undecaprenyl pyrophosphate phosphatase UppP
VRLWKLEARNPGVKAKYWLMFAGWQLAGSMIGFAAHHVDKFSYIVSAVMLFPGTALSLYVFRPGGVGNNWQKWTIFAVAAAVNMALFAIISLLKASRASRAK